MVLNIQIYLRKDAFLVHQIGSVLDLSEAESHDLLERSSPVPNYGARDAFL